MSVKDALFAATQELKKVCENPAKIAKILLMHHLGVSIEWLFLNEQSKVANQSEYFALVERFCEYEPLEYIVGKASFYGFEFAVQKGVLIPRPESEILVDLTFEAVSEISSPKIAEIGVGSGIISIMLAKKLPNASIVATDINETAIALARQNALKFGVSERISLIHTSLLDGVAGEFDMIVSNPPYIARDYPLDKFVQNEPDSALFGGEKGDEILKQIIALSADRGVKILACEMGYDQKQSLQNELTKFGFKAEFYKDLAGFDRGFVAKAI